MLIFALGYGLLILGWFFNWNLLALITLLLFGFALAAVPLTQMLKRDFDVADPDNATTLVTQMHMNNVTASRRIIIMVELLLMIVLAWPILMLFHAARHTIFKVQHNARFVGGLGVANSPFITGIFICALYLVYIYVTQNMGHPLSLSGKVFLCTIIFYVALNCVIFASYMSIKDIAKDAFGSVRLNTLLYFIFIVTACVLSVSLLNSRVLGRGTEPLTQTVVQMIAAFHVSDLVGVATDWANEGSQFVDSLWLSVRRDPHLYLFSTLVFFASVRYMGTLLFSPSAFKREAKNVYRLVFTKLTQGKSAAAGKLLKKHNIRPDDDVSASILYSYIALKRGDIQTAINTTKRFYAREGRDISNQEAISRFVQSIISLPQTEGVMRDLAEYCGKQNFDFWVCMSLLDTGAFASQNDQSYLTSLLDTFIRHHPSPKFAMVKDALLAESMNENSPFITDYMGSAPENISDEVILTQIVIISVTKTATFETDEKVSARAKERLKASIGTLDQNLEYYQDFFTYIMARKISMLATNVILFNENVPLRVKDNFNHIVAALDVISANSHAAIRQDSKYDTDFAPIAPFLAPLNSADLDRARLRLFGEQTA